MGRIAIAAYRPKRGKSAELYDLLKTHVSVLRQEGLVTDRESIVMRAADGTVVEVFEWASSQAIKAAHDNPIVQKMWHDYEAVCDYVPIATLPEATQLFSEFEAL